MGQLGALNVVGQVVGGYHHGPHSAHDPGVRGQQIAQKVGVGGVEVFDRFVEQHDPSWGKHRSGRVATFCAEAAHEKRPFLR